MQPFKSITRGGGGGVVVGLFRQGHFSPPLGIPKLPTASRTPYVQAHAPFRLNVSKSPQSRKNARKPEQCDAFEERAQKPCKNAATSHVGLPTVCNATGIFTALPTPLNFARGKLCHLPSRPNSIAFGKAPRRETSDVEAETAVRRACTVARPVFAPLSVEACGRVDVDWCRTLAPNWQCLTGLWAALEKTMGA